MNDHIQSASRKWWLIGTILGGGLPVALFLTCLALNWIGLAAGGFALALGILEIPVAIIGRALSLPIETGGIVQVLYPFNALGYAFLVVFWAFVGLFVGVLVGRLKNSS